MQQENSLALKEAPDHLRKGFVAIVMVLFSFTFFTGTMFAGAELGVAYHVSTLLWVVVIGNVLLALYAAALAWVAQRSGLNTVLMGRFCFGTLGSRLTDFILGFAELGWYAWGVATIAHSLIEIFGLSALFTLPLMLLFGILFCITALIGFKGLDILARLSLPVMLLVLLAAMGIATQHAGGWQGINAITPSRGMSVSDGITIIFGSFASGATQATNWSRLARTRGVALSASSISFLVGNGLMVLAGAWCAMIYHQADIVAVLMTQGLAFAAVLMLLLNLFAIQGPTLYNVSAAASHFFRTHKRRQMTIASAAIGIILAVAGISDWLVPFLKLLGSIIPPIGGIVLADYWITHKGRYPLLAEARLPAFNYPGLLAYFLGAVCACLSPWLAPVVGIVVAAVIYTIANRWRQ